ncbi:hypothetical protein SKAU_G00288520 [Synaphobranchus kaupii]|uniref:Uncharacterized protein n=1 Tax=Synaphobranchus kaupii TaxID=118154 RepID=A0A9Q1ETG7_SYNKA|nr:hypothetical protein SKAU_G00288520 [Synaphobranchus kaupii]
MKHESLTFKASVRTGKDKGMLLWLLATWIESSASHLSKNRNAGITRSHWKRCTVSHLGPGESGRPRPLSTST